MNRPKVVRSKVLYAGVAWMRSGDHELTGINADEFASIPRVVDEVVILAPRFFGQSEGMRDGPFPAIHQRSAESIAAVVDVFRCAFTIGEKHGAIAGNPLAGFFKTLDLVSNSSRCAVIIVIDVADNVSSRKLAADVSLLRNAAAIGSEIGSVSRRFAEGRFLPIIEDEQLLAWIGLPHESIECPSRHPISAARHHNPDH